MSSRSKCSFSTQRAERGRERENKGSASFSRLKERRAIQDFVETENHAPEGFVIGRSLSNRLVEMDKRRRGERFQ